MLRCAHLVTATPVGTPLCQERVEGSDPTMHRVGIAGAKRQHVPKLCTFFFFFFLYTAWNEAKNLGLESLSRQLIIAERQFVKQERLLICKSSSILIVSFKLKEVELIEIDWK